MTPEKSITSPQLLPRGLVVAGMGGGSGKSVVAVGLVAAFARTEKVAPFKKGPDYIDAGWLSFAAGHACYNLDPYLMAHEDLAASFFQRIQGAESVIVEGNRGLYDGVDVGGTYSTAELAISLGLPVVLVVDCTKTTRTVAAMVLGCLELDRRVDIRGVILNRIARARHEDIVRNAVEHHTGIPVLGAVPRQKKDFFPMRHLGVTPFQEHEGAQEAVLALSRMAEVHIDLGGVHKAMADIRPVKPVSAAAPGESPETSSVRIGVIKDAAFQFYYAENLEALEQEGAELVEINALSEPHLPDLDGLYIGGGFPETSAPMLSTNVSFRASVKEAAEGGLPIYAECGGLIYLGEKIILEGKEYPLAGVFPVTFGLKKKPQAHGYTILEAASNNPYYPPGAEIKGHEFRYSTILDWPGEESELAFEVKRGVGFIGGRDGLVYKNVLALYTHVHAVGTPLWAKTLAEKARAFQQKRY